ncbi:MAG: putative AEC-type transporter [Nitrospira sp.]|jgi:predicted permease|nr:putative AEC-type transporter [Nitrospira sp.]
MPATLQAFIAIFFAGALLRSFGLLGKVHAERLAAVVFSVSLPATILVSLDHVTFAPTAWKLPLAACLVTLTMLLCSWQLARLLQWPRATRGGFMLATGCINSVYFAYPVILATLGDQGLAQAILFDLGQTTLTLTVIYGLALWHGEQGSTARSVMLRFFSSPPLWALCASFFLTLLGLGLPAWLHEGLIPIHLTTTPLASLVLGLSISFSLFRRTLALALLGMVMRMGGGLLLGFLAAFVLHLGGMERTIVVLVAAMPSAVTAVVFATETGLDENLVASIVALSVCVGIALLPWLPRFSSLLMG